MTNFPNLFFILGCQRSGTTLTRLILESHSKVTCLDEYSCYDYLLTKNDMLLEKSENLCLKTPLLTEQFNEPFFTDPSLDFIIHNKYQKNKKIFMIRDVRDTIASMIFLKQNTSNWFEIWPKQYLEFWKYTIPEFKKKYDDDMKKIEKSKNPLFSLASFYWKYKNEKLFDYDTKNIVLTMEYETLVQNPKSSILKIIEFLGLEWEDNLLKHHLLKHSEVDENGITVGYNDTKKAITTSSVSQYKKILSKEQLNDIMSISGELMTRFGYIID